MFEAVIPVTEQGTPLNAEAAANRGFTDLHGWLTKAEHIWGQYNRSNRTLIDQLNYINQLSSQFPIPPLRVVYAKAGVQPASCLLRDPSVVVDHKLYWLAPTSEAEGRYLTAILNSETVRTRAEQFQARGQFGARDFDKAMFNLPIPRFDAGTAIHVALADTAAEAEKIAVTVELPDGVQFQRARALVRAALKEANVWQKIDILVAELLD
jgi:hypothetical protein